MILALHGQTTLYSNLASDIRTAQEAGFGGLEIATVKLSRYLRAGLGVEQLGALLRKHSIAPVCIDILADVERDDREGREMLLEQATQLCSTARSIGCPTVQLNAFSALAGRPWPEIIKRTATNVAAVADIGSQYGVRFQVEGAAWTPIHSLSQCLELIKAVDRENVGLVIDFWHLWATHETVPDEVARLDPAVIYGVHLCDGKRAPAGQTLPDERQLRGFLPGDGDIPVTEWVAAVRATGFDGAWAGEILCDKLWEIDHLEIAQAMHERMAYYLGEGEL